MRIKRRREKAILKDRKKNAPRPKTGNPVMSRVNAVLKPPKPTLTQENSPLFRLPPEIRIKIFAYVFSGHIHIMRLPGRLGYLRYTPSKSQAGGQLEHPVVHGLWRTDYGRWDGICSTPPQKSVRGSDLVADHRLPDGCEHLLSLLKSCKRARDEATPLLYQSINFEFSSTWNAYYFVTTVPAKNLANICEFSILLDFREAEGLSRGFGSPMPSVSSIDIEGWRRLWNEVSSMPRLQRLGIFIEDDALSYLFRYQDKSRTELLDPLKEFLPPRCVVELHALKY